MTFFFKIFALCISLATLTGCAIPRGAALSEEILKEQDATDPAYQVVTVSQDNIQRLMAWPANGNSFRWIGKKNGPASPLIRTGDRVTVSIWDNQSNSLLTPASSKQATLPDLQVSPTGKIFIPYLGDVEIRNMTPDQARQKIQFALEAIVPSAQVQMNLVVGQQNSVDLISGVARPGSYPLPNRNYSLLSLIAQSGGIQSTLRNPVVRLIRQGKRYEIPVDQLKSDPKFDIILRGNDKVLVEQDSRYFTALGATGREELVYFPRADVTALEAMSMIGGLSDQRANLNAVLLLRDYDKADIKPDGPQKQQVVFVFDLTSADGLFAARKFHIQPQDTLLATETVITSARTVLGVIGAAIGVSNAASNLVN
ncbi:MAG: polysaccharide biosynthesis/export family protein [Hyphomonas sp.]